MTELQSLAREIETYCRFAGMAPSSFGIYAKLGGSFYERLKAGHRSWPETIAKARQYMDDNPPMPKDAA